MQPLIITAALPYANGPLHLGHILEYIQADIWARWHRLHGRECYFICGSDAHGTPIMLKAQDLKITPEQLVTDMQAAQVKDTHDFMISFDEFYTTHSPENQALATEIYERLHAHGDILTRTIEQAYDPVKNLFLPDRFIRGTCPKCGASDQYGDNCEACGATYSPADLLNPKSSLSGATPVLKQSEHLFFNLPRYEDMLQNWYQQGHIATPIKNKLQEWFAQGLQAWDISRDAPYFGFPIPGHPTQFFYVWLDAPIGYMASFKHYCDKHQIDFDSFWEPNSPKGLYHFIGKDVMYFHALFWPAVLEAAHFRKPSAIFVHGFLKLNGQKMSKSRGNFLTARQYLTVLHPEYLRYYFAAKLNAELEDLDLHFDDFMLRVNADLIGKVINIASRCAGFIHKLKDGWLSATLHEPALFEKLLAAQTNIDMDYEQRDYSKAMRKIMVLADVANQYIDEHKPWTLAKTPGNEDKVQAVCTQGLNAFRQLMIYLKPVLPDVVQRSEAFLNVSNLQWSDLKTPLLAHRIRPFSPLLQRIEKEQIDQLRS